MREKNPISSDCTEFRTHDLAVKRVSRLPTEPPGLTVCKYIITIFHEIESMRLWTESGLHHSLQLDHCFFLRVLHFACNTGVCLRPHVDIQPRDIKGFSGERLDEMYRDS